jgi:hypothetical protein
MEIDVFIDMIIDMDTETYTDQATRIQYIFEDFESKK